jgi:DUF4097 and DUF4098 domain-containing protein YvlB
MGKLFKIALALFLIGVGAAAVFTTISEEPIWGSVSDEDYEYNELLYDADDFTGFNFDFVNRDFLVETSEDNQIKVTYWTTERDDVVVTDSGAVLKLENDVEWFSQVFIGWNSIVSDEQYFDVVVYLPDSVDYDIDFDTSNGAFVMSEIDNINELKFETSNGTIRVEDCDTSSMDFKTSNGSVTIIDCVTPTIDVYTSNGTITITNVETTGLLNVRTSNGKILLTDVESGSIHGKSSNQKIIAENIKCDDVFLDTSNGSISLTIYGDKADFEVRMDTSNGDMTYDGIGVSQEEFNLGENNKINLDTSNGDIEIIFVEE